MKISGVDFPKKLLDALKDNQLVVFAGAGVSIPEPAGLPSFSQLVKEVARGSSETRAQWETEDHFLGRLHDKDQQVHLQAARILQEKGPKPSCLHHDLAALYRNPQSLRIVTTNFDTLFEEAANTRFGTQPETFRAPALPLGRNFTGIIHVHGSTDRPQEMILTDGDFGRAYLTEGWARNFLLDLFRTFPVLFVGYGHNDTVMNYLARALPTDQTQFRFALTDETDADRWAVLGIAPVLFPKADEHDYSRLYEGVSGLAKYATRGILDWQSIITEIAKNPPSLDQEDMDTVGYVFSDPVRTRFFTEAASHLEWVGWLDENGHLDSLFETTSTPILEDPARILGRWLARTFAKDQPDELFRLVAKHGMDIHPGFWEILVWAIGSPEHAPEDAGTLSRWVSLLLETAPRRPNTHFMSWIGERCAEAGLTESLLDVFRHMSAAKTQVRDRITFSQDEPGTATTVEITNLHGQRELNELWNKGLKTNLNQVAEPLLHQLVDSFATRHRTLRAWHAATRDWDPESHRRSAIEAHEQDSYPEAIDVLIDAARDSLEYLACAHPEIAALWCDKLVRSDTPLLRRLAVHALNIREDLTPTAKIDWVMDKIGLHYLPAHHELFQVMSSIYPLATPDQREEIIEEILKFDLPGHTGKETAEIIAYEQFTWFTWLSDADPSCDLVRSRVEDIQKQYTKFKPREWAAFSHYHTGGMVSHVSPWSPDELLSHQAKEWAPELLSFREPDSLELERTDRIGLGNALEEAVDRNFQWGIELADTLAQSKDWETDLWPTLIKSWARRRDEYEQGQVLDRLLRTELQKSHTRNIAQTLQALLNEGNLSHGSGLLPRANEVALTAWDNIGENERAPAMEDWYERSINHPAGMLAEFWMHSLSSWYNEGHPRPERISEEYLDFMQKIVGDETTSGILGKSGMARQLRFLTAVDEEWVIEHLIPLLDSEDKDERRAVWEASFYDGISPRVAEILERPFLNALSDVDELFPPGSRARGLFVRKFTALVTHFVDEPLEKWVPKFFEKAQLEDRRGFALNIADQLRHMDPGPQQELWNRWLRQYWENRQNGTPGPLDPSEVTTMFHWLPLLHDLFPDAVELAVKTTNLPPDFSPTTHLLGDERQAESHPEATAKLLIFHADQNSARSGWWGTGGLIEKLLHRNLPEDMEHRLKEIQVELGL